jgi:glycosyltransferase involved in cell wall biosynthesis
MLFTVAGLHPESGGPSRSLPALCTALANERVEVELASLDFGTAFGSPLLPYSNEVSVTLVPCKRSLMRRFKWTPRFASVLRERCRTGVIDIVHDTGLWLPTNHAAATTARQTGIPFIVSPRGMLATWSLRSKGWKKRLAWHLYQRRDLMGVRVLHATSTAEANDFRSLGFRQPVAVIPNGVELPNRPNDRPNSGKQRVVLFLGRIHPVKGLVNLVRAWAQLRPSNWRVIVAGGNENGYQAEVEAAVRELGLATHFSFVGPMDGSVKWDLYRSADLFVLPSHSENFGLVVAEAMACGLPVITTKGTPWEVLEHARCGWWIDIGAEPLAHALREAVALSDAERREMGRRGRRLVETEYTWSAVAEQMTSVYRWVLGQGERPACLV